MEYVSWVTKGHLCARVIFSFEFFLFTQSISTTFIFPIGKGCKSRYDRFQLQYFCSSKTAQILQCKILHDIKWNNINACIWYCSYGIILVSVGVVISCSFTRLLNRDGCINGKLIFSQSKGIINVSMLSKKWSLKSLWCCLWNVVHRVIYIEKCLQTCELPLVKYFL